MLADGPAGAARLHHHQSSFEVGERLIDGARAHAVVDEWLRQAAVDTLRADSLPAVGELRDLVFLELLPVALGERDGDSAAERRRIDLGDVVGRRWRRRLLQPADLRQRLRWLRLRRERGRGEEDYGDDGEAVHSA